MKIVTQSNGKKSISMSAEEWFEIGKKSGWTKEEDNRLFREHARRRIKKEEMEIEKKTADLKGRAKRRARERFAKKVVDTIASEDELMGPLV